ncbi:MAG TPA: class III extradiol ring-cleavage dioxygenase [Pantanalinema sp.]
MTRFPALFVSHGAPTIAIDRIPAHDFLAGLGERIGRPKAILAISAHWETGAPTLSLAAQPATIHDFGGFPDALYRMTYPAPGSPELAERVAEQLVAAGFPAALNPSRGLDHGAWIPLQLMYPAADIPVVQLSIQPSRSPAEHWRLGEALRPLRDEGILVLGSGSATHNLFELGRYMHDTTPPEWVTSFDRWLKSAVTQGRKEELLDYLHQAPSAARNHPTPDHILPLFVAAGAGEAQGTGELIHESYSWGLLSMAAYSFA